MIVAVEYMEDVVEVSFNYYAGYKGSREEPPEDEYIEIEQVMYHGTDVSSIVDWDIIESRIWEMKQEIINDYADYMYEEADY